MLVDQETLDRVVDQMLDVIRERDSKRLLSVQEAAEMIGISPRSLRSMVVKKQIPSLTVGPANGTRVFERAEIESYIADRKRAA